MGYTAEFVTGAIIASTGYGLLEYVEPVVADIISGGPAPFDYAAIVSLGGLLLMGIGALLGIHALAGGLLTYLKKDGQPAPARQEQRAADAQQQRAPREIEEPRQERPQRPRGQPDTGQPPQDDRDYR